MAGKITPTWDTVIEQFQEDFIQETMLFQDHEDIYIRNAFGDRSVGIASAPMRDFKKHFMALTLPHAVAHRSGGPLILAACMLKANQIDLPKDDTSIMTLVQVMASVSTKFDTIIRFHADARGRRKSFMMPDDFMEELQIETGILSSFGFPPAKLASVLVNDRKSYVDRYWRIHVTMAREGNRAAKDYRLEKYPEASLSMARQIIEWGGMYPPDIPPVQKRLRGRDMEY